LQPLILISLKLYRQFN